MVASSSARDRAMMAKLGSMNDEEQDAFLDAMSPEDRERLYRALAKVEADGENADPKLTPNPHHSTDHDFEDPSFVEEVVRKLLSMAPDRQCAYLASLSEYARAQVEKSLDNQAQTPLSSARAESPPVATGKEPGRSPYRTQPIEGGGWPDSARGSPVRQHSPPEVNLPDDVSVAPSETNMTIPDMSEYRVAFDDALHEGPTMSQQSLGKEEPRGLAALRHVPPQLPEKMHMESARAKEKIMNSAHGKTVVGVGINFSSFDEFEPSSQCSVKRLSIHSFTRGGPAERNGILRKGDVLMRVAGHECAGIPLERMKKLISGPRGSTVTMCFQRPGSNRPPLEVCLRREQVLDQSGKTGSATEEDCQTSLSEWSLGSQQTKLSDVFSGSSDHRSHSFIPRPAAGPPLHDFSTPALEYHPSPKMLGADIRKEENPSLVSLALGTNLSANNVWDEPNHQHFTSPSVVLSDLDNNGIPPPRLRVESGREWERTSMEIPPPRKFHSLTHAVVPPPKILAPSLAVPPQMIRSPGQSGWGLGMSTTEIVPPRMIRASSRSPAVVQPPMIRGASPAIGAPLHAYERPVTEYVTGFGGENNGVPPPKLRGSSPALGSTALIDSYPSRVLPPAAHESPSGFGTGYRRGRNGITPPRLRADY